MNLPVTDWATLAAAATMGLAGSAHCLAMCGGLAAATGGLAAGGRRSTAYLSGLAVNLGRLGGYALLGTLAAAFSATLLQGLVPDHMPMVSRYLVALVLAHSGLRLLLGKDLLGLEHAGAAFWRLLRPLTGRIRVLPPWLRWPLVGLAWGWLPCGLVYSAAALALATGNATHGLGVMLAFGLGTLPSMLTATVSSMALARRMAHGAWGATGGVLLLVAALWVAAAASGILTGPDAVPGHRH